MAQEPLGGQTPSHSRCPEGAGTNGRGGAHRLVPKGFSHKGVGTGLEAAERAVPRTSHCPFLGLSFPHWKMVEGQRDDLSP